MAQRHIEQEPSGEELESVARDTLEHVGLLEGDELASWNKQAKEEPHWREKATTSKSYRLWRQCLTYSVFTILIFSTLTILLEPKSAHHKHDLALTGPAQLRPEEDYILDTNWDSNAPPTTREYTWKIEDHVLNPDGVYRPMILINGTFPGPLIECNEGDEIVVHVRNLATNATSIHWHGIFQNGTNHMDGTTGVTQCPIAPGHSFTYRFNVTGQTGTYYYHSHVSMQASDGLVGPMVIHPKGGAKNELQKRPYNQDRVVLLSDHYYDLSSELLWKYLAPGSENDEPVPPSALMNGRNVRTCTDLPNRNCTSNDLTRALFDLPATTRTRLRIINAGAFAEFSLQVDEHEFHVTEVDGTDVMPQSIHRLNINPAQRYSIIVSRPQASDKDMFWVRARMVTHCFAYEEPELQEEVWGVLRYVDDDEVQRPTKGDLVPQSLDWPDIIEVECRDLNTSTLEPVTQTSVPEVADHLVYLRSSFQIGDWRLSRGYLNDSSFRMNATYPILHGLLDTTSAQEASNGVNSISFNPTSQLVYQTSGTPTIDILIQNLDDGNHPFHLHGYKFWVLAQGHGYPPSDLHKSLNLTNPLRRDTVSVEAFGWSLIRFVADNPGAWAFHCHIGWHNEAGLGMVFATRMEEWEESEGMVEVRALCGVEGAEMGVGPDDNIWEGSWD
jgi:FtsP/CotA-like multicopper oxidase with cupredoxin domain